MARKSMDEQLGVDVARFSNKLTVTVDGSPRILVGVTGLGTGKLDFVVRDIQGAFATVSPKAVQIPDAVA